MKLLTFMTFSFLFFIANLLAQENYSIQNDTASNDIELFNHLEKIWNYAQLNNDTVAFNQLWADDITITVPQMPVSTKKEAIGMLKRANVHFTVYESYNISIRRFGDLAIVAGIIHRVRQFSEKKADERWQFTKVYHFSEKMWRVIAFQASEAPN